MRRRRTEAAPVALEGLNALRVLASHVEMQTAAAVSRARVAGATWQEVADTLGISKATALTKWSVEADQACRFRDEYDAWVAAGRPLGARSTP